MSSISEPLKYLFSVVYKDGSIYAQEPDDKSKFHKGTDEWSPSAFRDVELESVACFLLHGEDHVYSVNLINGEFSVDDSVFTMHDQDHELEDFKLVYFREVRKDFEANGLELKREYVHKYYFGYEAKDRITGKKVKRIMGVQ